MNATQLTFDQWIKLNPEFDKKEMCLGCDGAGTIDEDGELVCVDCDGDGEINLGFREYRIQKQIDQEKLKGVQNV